MADTETEAPAPTTAPPVPSAPPVPAPKVPEAPPAPAPVPDGGYRVLTPIDYVVDGEELHLEVGQRVSDLPEAAVTAFLLARHLEVVEVVAEAPEETIAFVPQADLKIAPTTNLTPSAPPVEGTSA